MKLRKKIKRNERFAWAAVVMTLVLTLGWQTYRVTRYRHVLHDVAGYIAQLTAACGPDTPDTQGN